MDSVAVVENVEEVQRKSMDWHMGYVDVASKMMNTQHSDWSRTQQQPEKQDSKKNELRDRMRKD